ncbi:MAG: sigma-54 dependent transcriptional regulator [Myxococcaceae bacterium]
MPLLDAKARVLVVDDHPQMAETLADGLSERGFDAVGLASSVDAVKVLEEQRVDALVTDLRMPKVDGLELLTVSRKLDARRPVIVMTAYGQIDSAIECIRNGAHHYLSKPFKVEELALFLERALDEAKLRRKASALEAALHERFKASNLLGQSAAMVQLKQSVERVAQFDTSVLIAGETGSGKSLVAKTIHALSERASRPLVTVSCAAIPENLIESELFGFAKGAFTGAAAPRTGLIEEADQGTLFLDEIGELALNLQGKLLDVLERKRVRPVGANAERAVDVRLIAASNRDLREMVEKGTFRQDLLYRLEVVTLELPPLRQRRDDVPLLVEHFLAAHKQRHARSPLERIDPLAMKRLVEHDWPGNVRELEHVIEGLVTLATGPVATIGELPPRIAAVKKEQLEINGPIVTMREAQKAYAAWVLEQLGGKKMAAAEKLQIDPKTLAKLLGSD